MSRFLLNATAYAFALLLIGGPIACALGAHPPRWTFVVYVIVLAFVVYGHKIEEGAHP
jgi:hypothetical protein